MDGWEELKKELRLYQKRSNAIWYTEKPVFCNFTKKQLSMGYIIATEESIIGICDPKYFFEKLRHSLFIDHEYIYLAEIESDAPPLKITTKKERQKMTNGLRYKILKKYNFKCAACGISASEAELQIDHIIPVSKGGKTEENNLQPLCRKCNSGKYNIQ